jgi:RNA polymerase sigma-70 factor (ECF subfamily)
MSSINGEHAAANRFATTRWSVVLAAGQRLQPDAGAALEALCRTYWYPLYAFVRRQGRQPAEAADLTQGFFATLLERDDLGGLSPDKGRFRSFLLASLKHYLINEADRQRAMKRGGGRRLLSLDFDDAESRYRLEPAHHETAESVFERQWALTLLDRVRGLLREEAAAGGELQRFEQLEPYLTGDSRAPSYTETAAQLNMTEAAVKMAVSRLRRRFHDWLRREIAETVGSPEKIDDEIRSLIAALQSSR